MIFFGWLLLAVGLLGIGDYIYQTKYNNNSGTVASAWDVLGYIFSGSLLVIVSVLAVIFGFLMVRRRV